MRKPDFFIVGAPKSATTSMYFYLKKHPEIFMPGLKEQHYFATDLDSGEPQDAPYFVRDLNSYLDHFRDVANEKRVGDASVFHLYSKVAAAKIREFNPEARIIVMLRNPVEMIYSLHAQHIQTSTEDIKDFEAALDAESERRKGRQMPRAGVTPSLVFYREVGRYAEQVERYIEQFGAERVHIIAYDDFRRDTAAAYRDTLRFLEVEDTFRPEFEVVNANRNVRSQTFRNMARQPWVRTVARVLIPYYPLRNFVGVRLWMINTPMTPRPPLSEELKSRLNEEFRPDIERLSALLNRDFVSLWIDKS